jgi:hypothetical protein
VIDAPTASVLCSAILSAGAAIIVAIVKYLPSRGGQTESDCHRRTSTLEARVAVVEANFLNLGRSFDEFRRELHEIRAMLLELTGRSGRSQSH